MIFFTVVAVNAQDVPAADVSVDSISISELQNRLVSSITVKNNGDDDASKVFLFVVLPFQTKVVEMSKGCRAIPTPSGWDTGVQGYVRCSFKPIKVGKTVSVKIYTTKPPSGSEKRFSAFVVGEVPDQVSTNNFKSETL